MERLIVEVAGVSFIGGLAYAVSNFYNLSPLDRKWSLQQNKLLFVAIPTFTYIAVRVYMGIALALSNKIFSTRTYLGIPFSPSLLECLFSNPVSL
jgi:predicted permease